MAQKHKKADVFIRDLLQMINKFASLHLIGMASPYQILDWYGGRHTCHTASGALGRDWLTVFATHFCHTAICSYCLIAGLLLCTHWTLWNVCNQWRRGTGVAEGWPLPHPLHFSRGGSKVVSRVSGHLPFWLGCFLKVSVNKYHRECIKTRHCNIKNTNIFWPKPHPLGAFDLDLRCPFQIIGHPPL